jgi:hypothetical protein
VAVVVALCALCVLVGVCGLGYQRVVAARDLAMLAERQQRESAETARATLARLLSKRAGYALARGDTATAELLAARAQTIVETPDARGILASLSLKSLPQLTRSQAFERRCARVARAAQTGLLACASERQLALVDGDVIRPLVEQPAELTALALSADARRLFSGDQRGNLSLWSVESQQVLAECTTSVGLVRAIALSEDGERLAIGGSQGRVELRTIPGLELEKSLDLGQPVSALVFGADRLALGGYFGALQVARLGGPEVVLTQLPGHGGTLTALEFAPSGVQLATGSVDRQVRIWTTDKPQQPPSIVAHDRVASSFSWSRSGDQLVYGTVEGGVHWHDTRLNQPLAQLPGHEHPLVSVALRSFGPISARAPQRRGLGCRRRSPAGVRNPGPGRRQGDQDRFPGALDRRGCGLGQAGPRWLPDLGRVG